MTERVGVRALQQHASEVVRSAAAGEIIEVTDRGRLVARLVPATSAPLEALIDAGQARLARRRASDLPPPLRSRVSTESLTSLLSRAREDER